MRKSANYWEILILPMSSMIEKHWKTGGWRGKLLSLGAKAGVPAIFRQ